MGLLPIIASIAGGLIQNRAASRASRAQQQSANRQMDLNERVYDDQRREFQPYSTAGRNALGAYNFNLGIGDRPSGFTDFTGTPGYQFRLSQGQQAIDNSAASSGDLFSGRTLRGLSDYGQGTGAQDFGGYMDRLAGVANMGQASAAGVATAAGNLGMANGNALSAIGNARAAGAIGGANALNDGIGNALGTWQYMQQVNNANPTGQMRPVARPSGFMSNFGFSNTRA